MSETTFNALVKKYFGFLEEYGFKVTLESDPNLHPRTDGLVEYTSDTTVVVIDSDNGYASVWFYRIKDGKKHYIDPVSIHEYLNTNEIEKKLLLSTNPKDQPLASALFNQKFLLYQPAWNVDSGTTQDKLEIRLSNYANWLKKYADLCLLGNFSRWPKFYEYKMLRLRADCLRRGQDDTVYVRVKDSDGKFKLVKQPIFKEDFEYIEKLKKEFSG
jgi:hypothetical protein